MHRPMTTAALVLALALTACGGTDDPTVTAGDLDATPEELVTETVTESEVEVVATPTEAAPTEAAPTATEPAAGDDDAPTFDEVCAGRDDEAFIEVLTPRADETVGRTFTVTGCGNTFEANYIWRVEGADGEVLADGFGTMSCGNGCVGEFEQEVELDTGGDVTLVVFESDANDGSERHVVEVPLTIS